eukprot:12921415-Prorocentrum_lima.AAC.1
MLPAWLRSRGIKCSSDSDAAIGSGSSDWLFPNALKTPGPLHILDNALKDTCALLPLFPKWLSAAKEITRFCGTAR